MCRLPALVAALLLPTVQPVLLSAAVSSAALMAAQAPAQAQSAEAVGRVAKAITVRIEGATQGSGVLVKRDGSRYTVLSAWHVVSSQGLREELDIYTPDGKRHSVEQGSIQRLGDVDMAVLTFISTGTYETARVGDSKEVNYDDLILVSGFPLNNSGNLRDEPGLVVANAELGIDQGYQLLYSNKTLPGMSGGALLNFQGQLVGIHGRGEKDELSSSGESVVKTTVNQGVPIAYYNLFASGAPVAASKTTATTSDDYLAQARASQRIKGRQQTVIRLANQALEIRPTWAGYLIRGQAKGRSKDYQGAIADYNKAVAISPELADAYFHRGYAKNKLKDYRGAIADYSRGIAINPQFAVAYTNRGLAKQSLNDHQGAIADYNKALEVDPHFGGVYYNRGNAKSQLRDYQGAIADYSTAVSINPQLAVAYHNRGVAKKSSRDYQGAIADYSIALAINPRDSLAYFNRGYARSTLRQYRRAIDDYSKAIAINPQDADAYFNRAYAKRELKDYQGAIGDYSRVIEIDSQDSVAYGVRGLLKSNLKDYQGAITDLSKAIALDPQDHFPYYYRGVARHSLKDYQAACADYKAAALRGNKASMQYLNSEDGAWCPVPTVLRWLP